MADLEEAGYLEQPHTSAGRVPTGRAYRFYVANIVRPERYQNRSDDELIRQEIGSGVGGPEEVLERASHVLSTITHNVSVVVSATAAETVLEGIQFVALSDCRVLVIVIPAGMPVRSRVVWLGEQIGQDELNRIANYLNENFSGWRLEAARAEIIRRLEAERALYDELLRTLGKLWRQGILEPDAAGIHLEGASHLMARPELKDPHLLRDLLRSLEEKERLVRLLSHYLQEADRTWEGRARVVIGLDAEPPMKDFALVGALCAGAQGLAGRVAVIGPPRMQYERAMAAVSHVARIIGEAISRR
jgi:heat-inducible transcriptional repressor